jgi:hypothetical protein
VARVYRPRSGSFGPDLGQAWPGRSGHQRLGAVIYLILVYPPWIHAQGCFFSSRIEPSPTPSWCGGSGARAALDPRWGLLAGRRCFSKVDASGMLASSPMASHVSLAAWWCPSEAASLFVGMVAPGMARWTCCERMPWQGWFFEWKGQRVSSRRRADNACRGEVPC